MRLLPAALLATTFLACGEAGLVVPPTSPTTGPDGGASSSGAPNDAAPASPGACSGPLTARFYDAGQALSVLLTLPDGRHILVDTGESPTRPCAGCKAWHTRVMEGLRRDIPGDLDAIWITHQHSDHVGGASDVLLSFKTALYVDNGLELDKTAGVRDARSAATATGAQIHVVDPEHPSTPFTDAAGVKLTPIVPTRWPSACPGDQNACSIALRVDYCESSLLFTGDAPNDEEDTWDLHGDVTLLQVGHHGSDTSTSAAFLQRAKPKYAVISAGKPNEGTNDGYCHPAASVVTSLTTALGGAGTKTMRAFDSTNTCVRASTDHWSDVPANDHLWLTARDGTVTLKTTGDGTFTEE